VFADYLISGVYKPVPAVQTLSNAMDVGDPSNFHRITDIFGDGVEAMRRLIKSYSISDEETRTAIREIRDKYKYRIDPHGAVGYQAVSKHSAEHPGDKRYMLLETAHPAKFNDIMEDIFGEPLEFPERLVESLKKEKSAISAGKDYKDFKVKLIRAISR
jgi:threonine synthase